MYKKKLKHAYTIKNKSGYTNFNKKNHEKSMSGTLPLIYSIFFKYLGFLLQVTSR